MFANSQGSGPKQKIERNEKTGNCWWRVYDFSLVKHLMWLRRVYAQPGFTCGRKIQHRGPNWDDSLGTAPPSVFPVKLTYLFYVKLTWQLQTKYE